MKTFAKLALVAAPVAAMTLMAAAPADAQSYRDSDRRDRTAQNALIGAVIGGVAGAVVGNGDGTYVAGGALAGAALGAVASSGNNNRNTRSYGAYGYGNGYNQGYGNQSYGNQGYRNSGYNSYGSNSGYGRSDSRSDCGYWRDGQCYRNQGHWERDHGINSRDYDRRDDGRDYRYDPRW